MEKRVLDIIDRYYKPGSLARDALIRHSALVAETAVAIARRVDHLSPDTVFIEEAAMLHDIGIFYTDAPSIGCTGAYPYVCHGHLGRRLLEKHGLRAHAMVSERHVGAGLDAGDIKGMTIPMPAYNMHPETIEEKIICFADCFFSKTPAPEGTMHEAAKVMAMLEKFGRDKVLRFTRWLDLFGQPPQPAALRDTVPEMPEIGCKPG